MPTHKSNDYKLSTVKYYLSHSKNQIHTCKKIFGCSERSLMRWVDKYKSINNITRKKRDYTAYKISNSHISFIKHQHEKNKTITIDELLTKLKIKYQDLTLYCSISTLYKCDRRILKCIKITITEEKGINI